MKLRKNEKFFAMVAPVVLVSVCVLPSLRAAAADDRPVNPGLLLIEHKPTGAAVEKHEKLVKSGARLGGSEDSINPPADAYSAALREYKRQVNAKVKRVWLAPKDGCKVLIRFSLGSGGEVSNISLYRPSELRISDQAGLQAIERARPLPPIPAALPSPLDAIFSFSPRGEFSLPGAGLQLYLPADTKWDAKAKSAISGSSDP